MHPIYCSDGAAVAVVHQGNLYNIDGEWIGVLHGAEVYDFNGQYLGYLSEDRRLLRARRPPTRPLQPTPSEWPERLQGIPQRFPLPPMFRQLHFSEIDVFEEFPERFKFVSDLRPDLE